MMIVVFSGSSVRGDNGGGNYYWIEYSASLRFESFRFHESGVGRWVGGWGLWNVTCLFSRMKKIVDYMKRINAC